jgi:hypothetical protein
MPCVVQKHETVMSSKLPQQARVTPLTVRWLALDGLLLGAVGLVTALTLQHSAASEATDAPANEGELKVWVSWGHQSSARTQFQMKLLTAAATVTAMQPQGWDQDDVITNGLCQTEAGGGDVDGLAFTLRFPVRPVVTITNLHSIWRHLLGAADADTRRRLQLDPAYRRDARQLTFQMNAAGTHGFSLTVDQLLTNKTFWLPELDVFISAGAAPASLAAHQQALKPYLGRRVLDQVRRDPEATCAQFTSRWEDMGSPAYRNPASVSPGHIVCVTWDSAIPKFGIDRGATVWNDYGNPDHFRFGFDFANQPQTLAGVWKRQKLTNGLPVITTEFERAGVRYTIEQFAYPLHGPPSERRGDLAMVLLQTVRLTELQGVSQTLSLALTHRRELPSPDAEVRLLTNGHAWLWEESSANGLLLEVEGAGLSVQSHAVSGGKWRTNQIVLRTSLPANGTREFVVKLPSPLVAAPDRETFRALDYTAARRATVQFWSNYLARGAQFVVPEDAVNELFRANLWHALRLPRRHGGQGANLKIDLPYSNFAYDQVGTPWPVNQAVYVDYMLYDLRGYHALAAEELSVMFRDTQQASGRIQGFANWGVYTPGMIYAAAQHYLLSGDRGSFEKLLPSTLKALDWCLAERASAAQRSGPTRGLILAPLNDLSHDPRAWAFNQAYLYGGLELLGQALSDLQHPRAAECRAAAVAMFESVRDGFGQASMRSPLVQLRDHTWMPYVPADALSAGRLMETWYPTDVDTGALHLSRLKALDAHSPMTTSLLNDHEDNLFLRAWGMANEPVYNQQAAVYLLRDEPQAAIRAFYSMMACAFSHSVFEPVEHRWGWGQYFGPPSTDGAWFELYRQMLIHERDDDTLLLLQATPRTWLEDGKQIRVARAPTYYGDLSMIVESRAGSGEIRATIELPQRKRLGSLLVRFRHPQGQPMRSVLVNGTNWTGHDAEKEWVRILKPSEKRYQVVARYETLK